MAEYHAVLKRAISSLPDNSGAARRAVYQRARAALVNQLKSYDPPLSPSQVTAEQLQLEDAIRKVEAEAAREAFARPPDPGAGRATASSGAAPRTDNDPSFAAATTNKGEGVTGTGGAIPPAGSPSGSTAKPETSQPQPSANTMPPQQSERARPDARTPPQRDIPDLADVENSLRADDPGRYAPTETRQLDERSSRLPQIVLASVVGLVLLGAAALAYSQRDTISDLFGGETTIASTSGESETPVTESAAEDGSSKKDTARLLTGGDSESVITEDTRSVPTTRIVTKSEAETTVPQDQLQPTGGPAPQVETIVPAEQEPELPIATESTPTTGGETESLATPAAEPSEATGSDTVASIEQPGTDTTTPAGEIAAPSSDNGLVAQRSILYEEGAETGSSGVASKGDVVWSTGADTSSTGTTHTALKASARIEDKGVQVDVSIRPNDDDALPASHLIEIRFDLPDDFAGSGIANVPGLIMKTTEEARGDALIGASVKVAENYFWVALSSLENERDRNLALLKDRGWIDIPVLYNNGKRAIITLEKGVPGDKAVETAFASWQTN
ncbi:MAG: hypothetical protein ABJN26_22445 [Stappiaceae bacterium]